MRVSRSSSWEEGYDLVGTGNAGASLMSPPLTKAEWAAYRKEIREKDAKRKPVGFARWEEETAEIPLRGAVSRSKAKRPAPMAKSSPRPRAR